MSRSREQKGRKWRVTLNIDENNPQQWHARMLATVEGRKSQNQEWAVATLDKADRWSSISHESNAKSGRVRAVNRWHN